MTGSIKTVVQDTPEKFQSFAEEIVPPLLELLRNRNALEAEIFARSQKLREENIAAGIPKNQTGPGEQELVEEYRQRLLELFSPKCTEKVLKNGPSLSYGKPAEYEYLDTDPECQVIFRMKSAKKAAVETQRGPGGRERHRFTLRLSDGEWKIDGVDYRFSEADTWHIQNRL